MKVNEYPRGCTDDCQSVLIGWIFYGIPFWISSLTLAYNNVAIFIFVRSQTAASETIRSQTGSAEQTARDNSGTNGEEKIDDLVDRLPSQDMRIAIEDSVAANTSQNPGDCAPKRQIDSQSQPTMTTDDIAKSQCHQIKRLRLVRTQALLFVMAYLLCVGWGAVVILLESMRTSKAEEIEMTVKYFPVLVGNAVFAPLTGFLNMMVFLRPKFLRWKHRSPQNTNLRNFWHSLLTASTSRQRAKRPAAPPELAERKSSSSASPAEKSKRSGDSGGRFQRPEISSLTTSSQYASRIQERQANSDSYDEWFSSDSSCTYNSSGPFNESGLDVISELTSSIYDASTYEEKSMASDKHSSGSNTTLSSNPGPPPWSPSEERWNPNHSPRIAHVTGKGMTPCDEIPQTPSRRARSDSRWSSSIPSTPSFLSRDILDDSNRLFMPQRVVSEVDNDAEVQVTPNIPSLKSMTESSPPTPSDARKTLSA